MEAVPSHEQPKKAIDRLSDYGEVCFASHGTKAEFCRGAEADSIRYIADEWDHMFAPGVLLRVSGTVEHVTTDDMTSSLNEIIDGVYLAAKKCGAWVLTSGLGEGVAPLVTPSQAALNADKSYRDEPQTAVHKVLYQTRHYSIRRDYTLSDATVLYQTRQYRARI
jgi:hypothetical protein